MTIPSVMFLEMALESLQALVAEVPQWPPLLEGGGPTTTLDREIKEFRMLGTRPDHLEAVLANGELLSDRERGYLLGLETARVLLGLQPDAIRAGVSL